MEELKKEEIELYQEKIQQIKKEIRKVIVGLDREIEEVLISLLCNGHVLFEGLPGLGKTMLVRTISRVLNLEYSRIQFTPDLMPADIIGTNILMEEAGKRYFDFQKGPLFSQLILADEINRATPKTQSALLEAMQELSITVAGETRKLKPPFFVLATQNPLEMEGTYPLPEAQIDRFFFKININYPSLNELKEIITRTAVKQLPSVQAVLNADEFILLQEMVNKIPVSSEVIDYAVRLIMATQPDSEEGCEVVKKFVNYGASPRGAQTLIMASKARAFLHDRYNVSFEDIRQTAYPALRHRILLNFEGTASDKNVNEILTEIISSVTEWD